MQPRTLNYQPRTIARFKALAALLAVALLLIIGWSIARSFQFHMVSTEPSLQKVGVATPYIVFRFNEPLTADGLQVSSQPSITSSHQVHEKQLTVNLVPGSLQVGHSYTIKLDSVHSTTGKQLAHLSYTFKVVDISFQDMPTAQQQAVLKQQATVPYTRNSITFSGTDALLNNGLTADQIDTMKYEFFLFSQSLHRQFSQVVIDPSTISLPPYDPDNPPTTSTLSFTVTIDRIVYTARLGYSGFSNAELVLVTSANTQVYDSGNLAGAAE